MFLLFLLSLNLNLFFAINNHIYGGGCAIQNNNLYYLGGKQYDIYDDKVDEYNNKVYQLNLNSINTDYDFNELSLREGSLDRIFTNVLSSTLNDNEIMIYGGRNVMLNNSFVIYDIKDNSIKLNVRASQWPGSTLNPDASIYNNNITYSDQLSTWLKSPIDPDLSILYGGYLDQNDFKTRHYGSGKVTKYSERSEDWTYQSGPESVGLPLFDHASTIGEDGIMYVLGGKGYDHNYLSFDKLLKFDIRQISWNSIDLKGDIPSDSIGHNIIYFKNKLFLLGGALDDRLITLRKSIHILDLKTNYWKKYDIPDLDVIGYRACVQLLNDEVLLTSFGLRNDYKNNIQLIDLNDMKLLKSYSINKDTTSLVWVFVPCLLVLLLVILLTLFILYKKGKIFRRQRHVQQIDYTEDDNQSINYTLNEFKKPDWYEDLGPQVKNKDYDLK